MVVGGRQAVTILTTATWWTGGIFLFLSLLLSVVHANRAGGSSEVQQQLRQTPTAPTEQGPSPLDQPATGTPAPATPDSR
jgi:preprotein translocase subunit SecG